MKYFIIKASLSVDKRAQYMNHQMNDTAKNKIYTKKSYYIYLDWLFDIFIGNDRLTVTKIRIANIIRHESQTDMQNNQHLQGFSITAYQ